MERHRDAHRPRRQHERNVHEHRSSLLRAKETVAEIQLQTIVSKDAKASDGVGGATVRRSVRGSAGFRHGSGRRTRERNDSRELEFSQERQSSRTGRTVIVKEERSRRRVERNTLLSCDDSDDDDSDDDGKKTNDHHHNVVVASRRRSIYGVVGSVGASSSSLLLLLLFSYRVVTYYVFGASVVLKVLLLLLLLLLLLSVL